jgi:hypothetical protein
MENESWMAGVKAMEFVAAVARRVWSGVRLFVGRRRLDGVRVDSGRREYFGVR